MQRNLNEDHNLKKENPSLLQRLTKKEKLQLTRKNDR